MRFEDLRLIEPLLQAIRDEGYPHPTPIQEQAIGHLLEGRDLLGCAQTGTGKTAAFALPILQRFHGHAGTGDGRRAIRALAVTPTRELAAQIDESFGTYGRHTDLRHTVVYGGVRQGPQARALKNGVDILTATPGRLLDLMGQRLIKLDKVEVFVLDEADRMLDMGFIVDIRRVVAKLPTRRQTLLFSATMPQKIQALANSILHDPVEVRVAQETPEATNVAQSVYFVESRNKRALLAHLLADEEVTRALIFTRTKQGADRVSMHLSHAGIPADVIHSDRPQQARQKTLAKFKAGQTRVLIASDIAARGIDVDDISHVFNFDLPDEPEVYVHRIGRTGRVGAPGQAVSFCGIEERGRLDSIESLISKPLKPVEDHPYPSPLPRTTKKPARTRAGRNRIPSRRRRL